MTEFPATIIFLKKRATANRESPRKLGLEYSQIRI
jgi:hypothetical protein